MPVSNILSSVRHNIYVSLYYIFILFQFVFVQQTISVLIILVSMVTVKGQFDPLCKYIFSTSTI